ncbi:hypothetical protein RND81_09G172800 [Saponaria officinalis]|uniref:Uncharacterized protein n=1 Tax=Saponaria officinalis TaxID=3572 RepID=A0AAW1ING5_SAPOF
MGSSPTNKLCLLFLIICASLVLSSFAGRHAQFFPSDNNQSTDESISIDEVTPETSSGMGNNDGLSIRKRLLRATTNDYVIVDPSPSTNKPPGSNIPHHD